MDNKVILNNKLLQITLSRLCFELIETYHDFSDTVFIGIQPRGVLFSERLMANLKEKTHSSILHGKLDVTFHRDDFRTHDKPLEANSTDISFTTEGKKVVLIDDVLFTGRTIRAAMDALLSFGRPQSVELLVLINRRFEREFPIQADFIGLDVDTVEKSYVKVEWEDHLHKENCVSLIKKEKE